jgi:hypothetical protein
MCHLAINHVSLRHGIPVRYVMYWNQPWWLLSSIHSCGVNGAERTHEHYLKSKLCTLWSPTSCA